MHSVISEKPYQFVPPYFGKIFPRLLQQLAPWQLRENYGVSRVDVSGLEKLKNSFTNADSVLLTPNHCRPADPLVISEVCRQAGKSPFIMASWHVFLQSRLQCFFARRAGAFSVYREGLDRQALQAGVDILAKTNRPLVVFPEGVISRTNDRLLSLMEGTSFIARSAAKKKKGRGRVVVHPIGLRYQFDGDIEASLHATLDSIEQRLSWRPRPNTDLTTRIYRVGESLLWLKEIEYFGHPQAGDIFDRLEKLINRIINPLENEWRGGRTERCTITRVKQLRIAILKDMVAGEVDDLERERRWGQLADLYLAQQLSHYAPHYVSTNPTKERLLETVERFEEDLTDHSRIHRPMSVTASIGDAIEVSAKRERGTSGDPLMAQVEIQLRDLLGINNQV